MDENLFYFTVFHLENSKTIYQLYIRSENADGLDRGKSTASNL